MRCLAGIAALLFAFVASAPAHAAAERILDFDSRIEVGADGVLTVTETIRVTAFGLSIKRGIYRDFPTVYSRPDGGTHGVGFTVLEVLRDGEPEIWFQKPYGNMQRVYIGRKDVLLRPGDYTYRITYRTTRQIGFFDEHDELYWNVTGNSWALPIRDVRATVTLPEGAEVTRREAIPVNSASVRGIGNLSPTGRPVLPLKTPANWRPARVSRSSWPGPRAMWRRRPGSRKYAGGCGTTCIG